MEILLFLILIFTPGIVFAIIIYNCEHELDKNSWVRPANKPKPFKRVILLHMVDNELKESYGHWNPNTGWIMIDDVGRYISIKKIKRWRY